MIKDSMANTLLLLFAAINAFGTIVTLIIPKNNDKKVKMGKVFITAFIILFSLSAIILIALNKDDIFTAKKEPAETIVQIIVPDIKMSILDEDSVICSGFLTGTETNIQYLPYYLIDNNLDTAWIEGDKSGFGENEWIQINFNGTYSVNGINIYNGYHKTEDLLNQNNRIKEVKIVFSDGTFYSYELPDSNYREFSTIDFERPIETDFIKLIIKSVYSSDSSSGLSWNDTCISELILY